MLLKSGLRVAVSQLQAVAIGTCPAEVQRLWRGSPLLRYKASIIDDCGAYEVICPELRTGGQGRSACAVATVPLPIEHF